VLSDRFCFNPERLLGVMAQAKEPAYLYLTTTGRRSGVPREMEIWFTRRKGRFYVIAEHGERAQWVRNLRASAGVQWRVAGATYTGVARVIDPAVDPALHATVQDRSRQKYGWGDGLVVELSPDPEA
jgi:deazaflavin-dependent oxidoreductase (nitroreductase family)